MASSRHAGPAGPCLFGRCASARHQGERTSTSRQTCCPLRFPRCAGSSGVSSGQGRPTPVASSLGRTGDDDTSSAPDDHTGPAEPELINPGCSTKWLCVGEAAVDPRRSAEVGSMGDICPKQLSGTYPLPKTVWIYFLDRSPQGIRKGLVSDTVPTRWPTD